MAMSDPSGMHRSRTYSSGAPDYASPVQGLNSASDSEGVSSRYSSSARPRGAAGGLVARGIVGFHGGFIGVDVFFVVSGFVITNVLLEERARQGTRIDLAFYARRIRRILPAATVVLILTIFFTYHYLSFIYGRRRRR